MYISKVINLNTVDLSKMNKVVVKDAKTLNKWDKQEELDIATPIIKEMIKYLSPQPKVHEFDKDSAGDQLIKVDLALEFEEQSDKDSEGHEYISSPHKIVAFQVKSSECGALSHMEKNKDGVFYDGTYYPCPGVFWCTELNLEVLISFANFVGGLVNPDIENAIETITLLRGTAQKGLQGEWLDYRRVRRLLTPAQWAYLQELHVITLIGGRVIYPG